MRMLIVVMGPSGAGKSRVGSALAAELSVPMLEGDDFHTDEARKKMASGIALEDADRTVWVDRLVAQIEAETAEQVVLACSALTHYVQRRLRNQVSRHPVFVLLDAPREVLADRMQQRDGHFMPVSLLDSQLEALRAPDDAIVVDACESVETIVDSICGVLNN